MKIAMFKDVRHGDVFYFDGIKLVKTAPQIYGVNAVNLDDGTFWYFDELDEVIVKI